MGAVIPDSRSAPVNVVVFHRLGVEPGLTPHGNVVPLLLVGVRRFFERHRVTVQKAPVRACRKNGAMIRSEHRCYLHQRDVHLILNCHQYRRAIGFNAL